MNDIVTYLSLVIVVSGTPAKVVGQQVTRARLPPLGEINLFKLAVIEGVFVFKETDIVRRYNPLVHIPVPVLDEGTNLVESRAILDEIDHMAHERPLCAINGSRQPYSITRSARPSNVAWISMPSALAAPTSLVEPFFIHIAGRRGQCRVTAGRACAR
jgi:hypothetical protein